MYTSILATKLFIPPPRSTTVSRPRLIERLNEALYRKLTLISAPAGYGKTTLVSEWVVAPGRRSLQAVSRQVAWLSLDENDSDLTRFLAYLIAALQTITPNLGEGLSDALQSPQPPPIESVLAALLNELAAIDNNVVLVLDDYHVINAQAVDHALSFLLEHLPPTMHLVITTREDPPLPLARMRVRGQLVELRAADLRFTASEAAEFLNQVMGLKLSAQEIAALESRNEGWIAGLQLAALSMQGHQDVPGFIRAFAGDHRYIADYLVEEVLQRQPERVRNFLLQTSILDRLSGPLCAAVTGQKEGMALLDALERGNFFVVPLDDKRHWYRYHHLFADVLHAHLMAEQPEQVSVLHQRASEWYEQNGFSAAAIRHALAANDFERAAGLIELAVPEMRRSRQGATLLGWLQALPDELLYFRPVLSAAYAWTLLPSRQLERLEARLQDAERWLDSAAAPVPSRPVLEGSARLPLADRETVQRMVVVDQEEFRRLPGTIAIYRAASALARGDVTATVHHAQRALDLAPAEDHLRHGSAAVFLGIAYWTNGDLKAAHQTYGDGMARVQRAGHIFDAITGAITLAHILTEQGRLHEAMRSYERGLQLATEQSPGAGPLYRPGAADMYVGMSELYCEHNDLDAAMQLLLKSKELGEFAALPQHRHRWYVAMARMRMAQADADAAFDLLHEAEPLYVNDYTPNMRPIAALKTRLWLSQGKVGQALGWVRERGLSVEDDLSYLREFEHITLARVLLARYQSDREERSLLEAIGLLERLLHAAQVGGRMGNVIEIRILQALARQLQGDMPSALMALHQALTLAEPEEYIRTFVEEGAPLAQLLHATAASRGHPGIMQAFIAKLLAAFGSEQPRSASKSPLPTSPAAQTLIEPLSQRELEVLRLFKTELSGPEIAHQLVVALSTVRTHTKGIYSKLNVNSRRAAVKRAEELNLI